MIISLRLATVCVALTVSGCSLSWFGSGKQADPTAEALYEQGVRSFQEKKYVRAIDSLTKIKTDHPFSPVLTEAELKIADAYYLNQQYPEAVAAFKEFQGLHPTSEHIPFVLLRLGQAHFDQFTTIDRDQKNTETAKGYFESVITNHPKSPYAQEAKIKLAKTLEYLAEHQFEIASFYFKQERYPAARDRYEEIVRKYKDTPTAVKSLFFLGESYRLEKNSVRAALAYEALIQHYPNDKHAADAKAQLAQLDKQKNDPLALLLMRDRRPGAAVAPEVKEDPALGKLRDVQLVTKKDVVHEDPDEKGFFGRVASKLNPFSSSDDNKPREQAKKPETAMDKLVEKKRAEKQESKGVLASLWPFGSSEESKTPKPAPKSNSVVDKIDASLGQKGIDVAARKANLKTPEADLPKPDPSTQQSASSASDTKALLGSIDSSLTKQGNAPNQLPPTPEIAEGFKNPAIVEEAIAAKKAEEPQPSTSLSGSGILSSIDQKLQSRGVAPGQFERPPTDAEIKASLAKTNQPKAIELEPKVALERGPLFLKPGEVQPIEASKAAEPDKPTQKQEAKVAESRAVQRGLVQGPVALTPAAKLTEKKTTASADGENRGAFDQLRQDLETVGKTLNPLNW